MSGGDADDLQALLGFSSFGRPRKRTRRSGGTRDYYGDRDNGPAAAAAAAVAVTRQNEELHDVVPGTEMESTALASSLMSSLRISPRGSGLLIKKGNARSCMDVATLFADAPSEAAQQSTIGHHQPWTLPASSQELLDGLHATKSRFATLDPQAFALARRRGNPYESLGRNRFINRSAMKMANLDFLFQWTHQHCQQTDPFVFADICGGPGGFSEYVLWRMSESVSSTPDTPNTTELLSPLVAGFGISLRGTASCDWKVSSSTLHESDDAHTRTKSQFHICDGADGTGDLYKIENIQSFREELRRSYPSGAQLVVADGGFPDARDQSNQELMMTRLVVAETLAMFSVLRVGGSFVCKTFELSTSLMLQLTWLLHQCFDELTVVKPVTSRPASSERYIVAQKLHADLPLDIIRSRLALLVKELADNDPLMVTLFREDAVEEAETADFLAFMAHASDRHVRQQINACETTIAMATHDATPQGALGTGIDRFRYYRRWGL